MRSSVKRRLAALMVAGGLSFGMFGMAGPATAQPMVTGGLVNVTIVDLVDVNNNQVAVQVPIGIAANVCPTVNAAVLAQDVAQTGTAECEADTTSIAGSRQFGNFLRASGQQLP